MWVQGLLENFGQGSLIRRTESRGRKYQLSGGISQSCTKCHTQQKDVPSVERRAFGLGTSRCCSGRRRLILFICSVPNIFREPLTEGPPGSPHYYELIGKCYVDGVMDGEAIHELGKEELKA